MRRRIARREFMTAEGHVPDCDCSDSDCLECDEDRDCDCEACMGDYSSDEF